MAFGLESNLPTLMPFAGKQLDFRAWTRSYSLLFNNIERVGVTLQKIVFADDVIQNFVGIRDGFSTGKKEP